MSASIRLRCPKCRRVESVQRTLYDYPEAVTVEVICPNCDDGDFCELVYYDRSGAHITRDPDETRATSSATVQGE